MKGKTIGFRPRAELRQRLETLAAATERPYTWIVEKCLEAHLPALEKQYAREIRLYLEAERSKKPKAA